MSAQSREQLLDLTETEWAKLQAELAGIDADTATTPGVEGITIKDTVAHRAHWVELFLGWHDDAKAGKPVHTPAPGYKWNQLKAYNAKLREASQDQSWDEVRAALEAAHKRLVALIEDSDDTVLYGERLYDWMNDWTLGRWAEASGPSHYRSARKYIRQLRREIAAA